MTINVSNKGQVVIPAKIRKRYNLHKNSKLEILDTGHSIILKPVSGKDPFASSFGVLKGKLSTKEFLQWRKMEKKRENS